MPLTASRTDKMDHYTKSILTVFVLAVIFCASNPWSRSFSPMTERVDPLDRIESHLGPVSSSVIVAAVLVNAMNPWIKPIVRLAKSQAANTDSDGSVNPRL